MTSSRPPAVNTSWHLHPTPLLGAGAYTHSQHGFSMWHLWRQSRIWNSYFLASCSLGFATSINWTTPCLVKLQIWKSVWNPPWPLPYMPRNPMSEVFPELLASALPTATHQATQIAASILVSARLLDHIILLFQSLQLLPNTVEKRKQKVPPVCKTQFFYSSNCLCLVCAPSHWPPFVCTHQKLLSFSKDLCTHCSLC